MLGAKTSLIHGTSSVSKRFSSILPLILTLFYNLNSSSKEYLV